MPLVYSVNVTRGLILMRPEYSMLLSFLWLVALAILLFMLSMNLMVERLIR